MNQEVKPGKVLNPSTPWTDRPVPGIHVPDAQETLKASFNEPTVESNVNFPAPISSDTYNLGVSVNGKKFDVNGNVDIEIPSPYTPPTKTKFQDNNFSGDLIILDNIPIFIYYVSHNGQILMEGEDDDYTVIDNEITLNYSLSNRKIIVVYEY